MARTIAEIQAYAVRVHFSDCHDRDMVLLSSPFSMGGYAIAEVPLDRFGWMRLGKEFRVLVVDPEADPEADPDGGLDG